MFCTIYHTNKPGFAYIRTILYDYSYKFAEFGLFRNFLYDISYKRAEPGTYAPA